MKFITTLALVLFASSVFAAQPTTISFQSYSGVGLTNTLNTCSVLKGKLYPEGTFNAESVTNYAIASKAGTSSAITLNAGSDYKIACFQTAAPATAATVKMLFDSSTTNWFPVSSLLYHQR